MNQPVDNKAFDGATILVTGASGFIGTHLCNRLAALGAQVHGVSRTPRTEGCVSRWWQVALDDQRATHNLVRAVKPDIIYHLASFVSGSRAMEHVVPALRGNLMSTVNLLESASDTGCHRIVLTGSLEETQGEASVVVPASPYAAAKSAASAYARMFHALYDTPAVTARLFMVFGPDQKDLNKLIPYVTVSLLRGEAPQLMSGTRAVDWIFVDDVIDAYLALATRAGIEGKSFDVGSGELTSVREVVMKLVEIVGSQVQPVFGSVNDRPMERVRVADVACTRENIGWSPKTSLVDGLTKTVAWYRNTPAD